MIRMILAQTVIKRLEEVKEDEKELRVEVATSKLFSEQTEMVHKALINKLLESSTQNTDAIEKGAELLVAELMLSFETNIDKYNTSEEKYLSYEEFLEDDEIVNNLLNVTLGVASMIDKETLPNSEEFDKLMELLKFSIFTDLSNIIKAEKGIEIKIM